MRGSGARLFQLIFVHGGVEITLAQRAEQYFDARASLVRRLRERLGEEDFRLLELEEQDFNGYITELE